MTNQMLHVGFTDSSFRSASPSAVPSGYPSSTPSAIPSTSPSVLQSASPAALQAHCPRLYRARHRAVDPVRHLAPGAMPTQAVVPVQTRVLLLVLLLVVCPAHYLGHLPVLPLVHRRVIRRVRLPGLTVAIFVV
jgi:hypothetical protein